MNKIILVDGNNLLFRSYYATAYNGNFMKNSKGFPTNALFGFVNMMNKIIEEEKPNYIMVAFDKGKTFRHDKYEEYKSGRIEMPEELKIQFPVAKEMLLAMGINYYEIDNYEADDIIGTFAQFCDQDANFIGTIISSDKDLLQLISTDIDIKLLKQKDYIRYNQDNFKLEYGIDPIRVIDLKALMGDSSDNIPGVQGIGEKTALKLLQEYDSLDNIYNNIEKITGKVKEKLINDKTKAYMSYDIATIYKEVPINLKIEDTKYSGPTEKLNGLYEDLEFYSLIKKNNIINQETNLNFKVIKNIDELDIKEDCAVYLEILGTNYHNADIIGMGLYNKDKAYYIPFDILKDNPKFLIESPKYTYDLKKVYIALKWAGIDIEKVDFDLMIAASLLDYNVKDDIAYLANSLNFNIPFYETIYGKNKQLQIPMDVEKTIVEKAKFIYEIKELFQEKLKEEQMDQLFIDIEMPLTTILGDMEYDGVYVDKSVLEKMGEEIKIKLELVSNKIYNIVGEQFNISSPLQLGKILFEKLQLPYFKKGKSGYSTAVDVLEKLKDKHPVIEMILEYRMLSKLHTTYIEGLINSIMKDGKIHTIYTQVLTKTGRLSSTEPNLQNIPIRYEYGRLIRKAFVPSLDSFIISADYSQIELRILAHLSKVPSLVDAFNHNLDIHTKTAADIFNVDIDYVTKDMRRIAKAVNFGIIYGISSFGLSENLHIKPSEAKEIIDKYLKTYPGIKEYMDKTIALAKERGYTVTLFNRKRNITELKNSNYMIRQSGERMALNAPIQGTNADIIKKAMIEIANKFKLEKIKSKMILQVHDELVFDVVVSEKKQVIDIITNIMENIYKFDVPLKVDIEYGDNWYQAK